MAPRTRTLLFGSIVWVLNIQYFIVQVVVASRWKTPFSPLHNTISDLGNTACGPYRGSVVCSPQHLLMNVSFLGLGIGMMLGAAFVHRTQANLARRTAQGIWCMVLAGIGTMLVGLFPENTIGALHTTGASLPFVLGNIALLFLGGTLAMPRVLRIYTLASGLVGLAALVLFTTHTYIGLGIGGTERITAYPQTIWLVVYASYILYRAKRGHTHS